MSATDAHPSLSRTALITGASAGIGAGYARLLASSGFNLILTARREERLVAVATEAREQHGVTVDVIPADLRDADAIEALVTQVSQLGRTVDVLINNAGLAVQDYFLDTPWTVQRDLIDVLMMAPVRLSHAWAPGMIDRGWGRIINVSSLASFVPETAGDLYIPAKKFLVSFSRTLARELAGTGVHVTALCPGFTKTEFHDVLGNREKVDRMPRWMWSEVEPVVRAGWVAVEKGREVCLSGTVNRGIQRFFSVIPAWMGRRMPHARGPGYHGRKD